MKPYISDGNRKMSCPTFSLPAIKTCPGCTKLCSSKCYARKAERAYPAVMPCRTRNLDATKQKDFVPQMIDQIHKGKPKLFRIHESGDFYSQAYLAKWFAICRACPETRFLAFTKSFHLDFSGLPENLQIVWSVWPDTDRDKVPAGPKAFAGDCQGMGKVLKCEGYCDTCGVCWRLGKREHINVHFEIH